ncbi:hypothetical protein OS493_003671 [Desmophyllum pertusum]|uniref:Uncharacterized protein n=1 Tax=Desmophyllum pertusum TaxID=174260 RepID=A0A9X0A6B0_9CNID|nr:hypothetical protein OS493_003671 [Desmophyllum pertusum]
MNTLRSEDGNASERELLVDDIQRIREVLHISAGRANKLSSDEEEGEGSEEEKRRSVTSNNSQHQNVNYVSPLNSKITSPGGVFKGGDVGEQSPLSERKKLFLFLINVAAMYKNHFSQLTIIMYCHLKTLEMFQQMSTS